MGAIPRDPAPDSTLALLREGYRFIGNRCARFGSDLFETRLMLRRAVCMSGEEAARTFYHPGRATRRKAMPPTTLQLLQDKGSVQLLDADAHRRRKNMFLTALGRQSVHALVAVFGDEWERAVQTWRRAPEVTLLDEASEVLCRAACRWVGAPLTDEEAKQRTSEFRAMLDGAGSIGPRMAWGLLKRRQTEAWARSVIERLRRTDPPDAEPTPAQLIASHRDLDGRPLELDAAAVELINLVRPTVAVARFIVFAALALHDHPEARPSRDDTASVERFVQEVRRTAPFFPFVGGRVREPFAWRDHRFEAGDWMILDLYGTNHDPRIWSDPDAFHPERFAGREPNAFELVPQGAGIHELDHRCPGEDATIELMKEGVRRLLTLDYRVPPQDLDVDLSRMPAGPRSGLVMGVARST